MWCNDTVKIQKIFVIESSRSQPEICYNPTLLYTAPTAPAFDIAALQLTSSLLATCNLAVCMRGGAVAVLELCPLHTTH